MGFHHIKRDLGKAVRRAGISSEVSAAAVVEASRRAILEVMGKELGGLIEPLHIRNGTLTVQAPSAIIIQEAKFKEHEIIEKTNALTGGKSVRRLLYLI